MSNLEKSNENLLKKLVAAKPYTMSIQGRLLNKIKNHLNALKYLGAKENTLQNWITAAIKENLESELQVDSLKIKQIGFTIESELNKKILQRINLMKQFRRHYSKKQLILEAICDKLEKEESKTKEALQRLLSSSKKIS